MKLVVFDIDGTLIDSGAEITTRVFKAFADVGLPAPAETLIRANVGLSLPVYLNAVSGSDDPDVIAALFTAYRAASAASPPGRMPMFGGIREVLERLQARPDTLLAVATGKGKAGLDKTLSQNEMAHFFASLQTPDSNPSKPHPGMLLSAMNECGAEPADTLMIGDAVFDIQMAQAANVRSIGVAWGMQPVGALAAAGATATVDRVEALQDLIEQLLEEKTHA